MHSTAARFVIFACLFIGHTDAQAAAANARDPDTLRVATFNIAMGLSEHGDMQAALEAGDDPRLESLAKVLQIIRPDIVVLNEFDFDPSFDPVELLNVNYLQRIIDNGTPIGYRYSFRPVVNTGVDSGHDLDQNGSQGEPADAWGFGHFPGQYGTLILSQHPIDWAGIRAFRGFPWAQLPGAMRPLGEDGSPFYPDKVWSQLRLSSKNHVDIPLLIGDDHTIHLLVSHPTPPVFDGPEDRNGARNHDEIAFWAHYVSQSPADWIVDDARMPGGLAPGAKFVIAGDLNADPNDGDAHPEAISQLLKHPRIDASCVPRSEGGARAAAEQGGINTEHRGNPAEDTSDFNDETVGNYRLDYVLPSSGLETVSCGVYWPAPESPEYDAATFSDHRLVWIDIKL